MYLEGKEPNFRKQSKKSNPYRVLILIFLIIAALTVLQGYFSGEIKPFFLPTTTPTRTTNSYVVEGNTHFEAGNLNMAIDAFKRATELDPNDPLLFAQLARIQVYSSASLTTDAERITRLRDALTSIDKAKALAPNNSMVLATRAFVLNWNANPILAGEDHEKFLNEAEREAMMAMQMDSTNTLALAYYAEILVDQMKWTQAQEFIQSAMQRDDSLMDVHRIMAYTYETLGQYNFAIEEYKKAAEITPNLTFLYISIGKVYRHLQLYELALEYFAKAANLNAQLGINDPIPYLAIANTYAQMGEFFSASRNVRKALDLNPGNADVYAQLGLIYHKSRNYEGAIPALKCALEGCTAEESCDVRQCDPAVEPMLEITGLPLTGNTVVYYFTYGSVLAGLHRPGDEYCAKSLEIMGMVKSQFSDEPVIMSIVQASEEICQAYAD